MTCKRLLLSVALVATTLMLAGAPPAFGDAPAWQITTEAAPTYLPPGGEGQIVIAINNLGDGASTAPVTVTDTLPTGITAKSVRGAIQSGAQAKCPSGEPSVPFSCTFSGTIFPYEPLLIFVEVRVEPGFSSPTSLPDLVNVEGGGAVRSASSDQPLQIDANDTPFGVQSLQISPYNEDATPATQAGSQPFQLTTTLVLNQNSVRQPVALPRDLSFELPAGLVGSANLTGAPGYPAQCSEADFSARVFETNLCPPSTAVGVATVTAYEPLVGIVNKTVPVFNLIPAVGEPARFGFEVIGDIPVIIDTSVRSEHDYNIVATVHDTTQTAGLLSSQVTLWGDPGDSRHNSARGWECVGGGYFFKYGQISRPCPETSAEPDQPFLRLPTSCDGGTTGEPLVSSVELDSWTEPRTFISSVYDWMTGEGEPLGFDGCPQLPFTPQIAVAAEQHTASTPTGITVSVRVPQTSWSMPESLAQSDLRGAQVTLPQGVQLSPAAANGLEGCSEEEIEGKASQAEREQFKQERAEQLAGDTSNGLESDPLVFPGAAPECPNGSKLGTARIKTPLLSHELEGSVYLASPAPNGEAGQNPFDSLVALYLIAEDHEAGILVKLAGKGEVGESTGQITTTFANSPQVPFEELKLQLFGGPRASLTTPAGCGNYETSAALTPWSGKGTIDLTSPGEEFSVVSGPAGSDCPSSPLPFSPGFVTQNTSTQAGAFTNFDLELSRPDGDQTLGGVTMHLPEGVAALLSAVELCSEAQAATNTCPAGSEVGEATAIAGLGPEPYVQHGGRVYITGPYHGGPFGLDIVTPADAGPFNLGYISVRSQLEINPESASVTIASDPLPTEIHGIPLQLKRVLVTVNRRAFEFNPTDCGTPFKVEGTVTGTEGADSSVSSPYPVTGCSSLPFGPTLKASAVGHGSKAGGTTFKVTVTSGGAGSNGVAQAGIAKVDLQLPKQLSSRLPTLQKACSGAVFNSNPAACDEGSVIGYATIHTPVLKNPLSGPAYLVSHGNAAFPDVEFELQGEGIKLVLDGKTQIKDGITYSKFESTPDAPFTVFETVLPAGPHGVLTPNVAEKKHFDLCGETLAMPTTIAGQNGAVIERTTRIAIEGCGAVKAAIKRKLTNGQELARALKACRKKDRHSKARRVRCELQARRRYPLGEKARRGKHARKRIGKR